ncbi:uncharacterized protein LOC108998919 isoform X1 [Juglans regia]|uniref:Uncharacterized protein LOC108998919 isoform X1 n=1 Tax=Juglans regia TaxID=51240 RepID=A0A6P9DTQ7_JUGRE|nr:uncharacterized protein LOC108998919 isoform X1 [Juglans regia]
MEKKKTLRGVQKRKPTKRSKKKLLKKVGDYLRSDSYMFAPLISSQSKTLRSSAERAEVREPIRENKNKSLIEKIGEYLKSDTYMYAPLVDPPRSISPLPTISTQNVTMEDNEPTDWSSDIVGKDQTSKSFLHETSISEEQTFGHGEMVKHMVYKNCHSTSVSGHILYPMTWSVVCPFARNLIS